MEEVMTKATEPIENMLERLNAQSVFGVPTKEGEMLVIPVAAIRYGFGFGSGRGATDTTNGGAGGAGSGAMGSASPRGYIRIGPDGIRYDPIVDSTRISLAGIAMIVWNIFWIGATIRSVAKTLALRGAKRR